MPSCLIIRGRRLVNTRAHRASLCSNWQSMPRKTLIQAMELEISYICIQTRRYLQKPFMNLPIPNTVLSNPLTRRCSLQDRTKCWTETPSNPSRCSSLYAAPFCCPLNHFSMPSDLNARTVLIYSKHVGQPKPGDSRSEKECKRASATSIRLAMTLAKYLMDHHHYHGLCEQPFGA